MSQTQTTSHDGYLRLPQVLELIPVSRSTWYRGMKSGRYPLPVKIGQRAAGWKRSVIAERLRQLDQETSPPWEESPSVNQ